jgi:hypothetical protein
VIVVPPEVLLTDEKVVIFVQLPELTIYYIEMFIREVIRDLVNVIFLFQAPNGLKILF